MRHHQRGREVAAPVTLSCCATADISSRTEPCPVGDDVAARGYCEMYRRMHNKRSKSWFAIKMRIPKATSIPQTYKGKCWKPGRMLRGLGSRKLICLPMTPIVYRPL